MPKFKVTIERRVTTFDTFERVIEAPDQAKAELIGEAIASDVQIGPDE